MRGASVLLGAALALVAAACGDSATSTPTTTATLPTEPVTSASTTVAAAPTSTTDAAPATTTPFVPAGPGRGGEAVILLDQEPGSLNPYAPTSDGSGAAVLGQLYLVGISEIDESLTRVPEVLQELPTAANGGVTLNGDGTMTIRYLIRDEARWADGESISGADFLFTLETLAATEAATLPFALSDTDLYGSVVPGSPVAGPKTFEFTLAAPTLLHEAMFSTLLPAHDVAGTDLVADWDDRAWVEGGPFRLEEWVRGESISFVRNDNYWKTDAAGIALPYLDRVVVNFIPDNSAHQRAFTNREVDVFSPVPFESLLASLEELAPAVALNRRDSVIWEHFNFQFGENNPNPESLSTRVDFRRAVAHAIDRQALADLGLYANSGRPLRSYLDLVAAGVGGAGWDRYPYDPDRARELLASVCAELARDCAADPPRVVFATTSNADERPAIGNAVREMLRAVGIEVELDFQDSSVFFGPVIDAGAWDMGLWAWVAMPGLAGLAGIHEIFDPARPPPIGSNHYRWGTAAVTAADNPNHVQGPSRVIDEHTARYTEIVAAMQSTVDGAELAELAREAEDILADQVVIIPLLARGSALAWWADELGGVVHNPTESGFTWNVEEWYRTGH